MNVKQLALVIIIIIVLINETEEAKKKRPKKKHSTIKKKTTTKKKVVKKAKPVGTNNKQKPPLPTYSGVLNADYFYSGNPVDVNQPMETSDYESLIPAERITTYTEYPTMTSDLYPTWDGEQYPINSYPTGNVNPYPISMYPNGNMQYYPTSGAGISEEESSQFTSDEENPWATSQDQKSYEEVEGNDSKDNPPWKYNNRRNRGHSHGRRYRSGGRGGHRYGRNYHSGRYYQRDFRNRPSYGRRNNRNHYNNHRA